MFEFLEDVSIHLTEVAARELNMLKDLKVSFDLLSSYVLYCLFTHKNTVLFCLSYILL